MTICMSQPCMHHVRGIAPHKLSAQVFLAAGSDVGGDYTKPPPALYFDGMKVCTAHV